MSPKPGSESGYIVQSGGVNGGAAGGAGEKYDLVTFSLAAKTNSISIVPSGKARNSALKPKCYIKLLSNSKNLYGL